jgi:hypothetical protein
VAVTATAIPLTTNQRIPKTKARLRAVDAADIDPSTTAQASGDSPQPNNTSTSESSPEGKAM